MSENGPRNVKMSENGPKSAKMSANFSELKCLITSSKCLFCWFRWAFQNFRIPNFPQTFWFNHTMGISDIFTSIFWHFDIHLLTFSRMGQFFDIFHSRNKKNIEYLKFFSVIFTYDLLTRSHPPLPVYVCPYPSVSVPTRLLVKIPFFFSTWFKMKLTHHMIPEMGRNETNREPEITSKSI